MAVVLLVDDDADSSEVVARFLSKGGHRVVWRANGREALNALSRELPDVVILDAKMPEMDGTSFLDVIRCYLRWRSLPVIMLTGYAEGPHIRCAAEWGVKRTFLKGECDLRELLAAVEEAALPVSAPEPGGDLRYRQQLN